MVTSKKKAAKVSTRQPARTKPPSRTKGASAKQLSRDADPPTTHRVPIAALGGQVVDILRDADCARGEHAESIDQAIKNFIALEPSALSEAEEHIFRYYLDCKSDSDPGEPGHVEIASAQDVWKHIQFGFEATVGRRTKDSAVYVSLECNCDWEPEHGLQLVFRDGRRVNKVGPFDGHVTNSDAYADPRLENVIYRPR
jgi:hypothetical protein